MNYEDLLSSDKWEKKRNNIIQRDKHTCKSCNNSTYSQLPHGLVLSIVSKLKIMIIYNYIENKTVICLFPSLTTENYFEKIAYFDKIDGYEHPVIMAIRDLNFRIKQRDENSLKTIFDSGKEKEMNFLQIAYEEQSYYQLLENDNLNNFSWLYGRNLNVHHKYYQENKKPWEYENEALETLCWDCHEKLHKDGQVKVFDENMNEIAIYNCCKRCHGVGWFPEFTHIQSGLCFRCKGACYEELIN